MIRASIVGASGYAGGELLRLLLGHPHVEPAQVTSESHAGKFVHQIHPNLRGRTRLEFVRLAELQPCDVLFLALPHGEAQRRMDHFASLAGRVIDLSSDFRLRDVNSYSRWYGHEHAASEWTQRFVYGLPELHREELRQARYVSGVGCNATAGVFALLPLVRAGWIDSSKPVIVDIKAGSSEGGNAPSLASHHPERSGSVRSYAPVGHRHTGEVEQELRLSNVHLSVTAIELVRGVLATAHAWTTQPVDEKDLWRAFRKAYRDEPFVRIVHEKQGVYRHPEPKILAGANFVDVGFEVDSQTGRVVTLAALDNLMKGASGSALQCLNLMMDWPETCGLEFPGLHPV